MNFSMFDATIMTLMALILVFSGLAAYNEIQRPTIEIMKDEWECTKSEQRTNMQPMLIGSMTIMQPMTSTICVEYRRHAG